MSRCPRWVKLAAVAACVVLVALSVAAVTAVSGQPPHRAPTTRSHRPRATLVRSNRSAPPGRPPPPGRLAQPGPLARPGWTTRTVAIVVQGRSREYLVARPDVVTNQSVPVLLVLPGRDMSPAQMERASGFLSVVGQAVVVYPAGFGESWNAGYCCGAAHRDDIDDVAFLQAVVRSVLASQPGTSAHQVYLAGFSNGGRMAYDMACADPGAFAGIAAVEAVAVATCDRTEAVPIIEIASTGDPLLSITDQQPSKVIAGHVEATVQELVSHWRDLDACRGSGAVSDFGAVAVTEWSSCRPGGRVDLAIYQGGHHAWPQGSFDTPSAQVVIWDLFRGARLQNAAKRTIDATPNSTEYTANGTRVLVLK